MAASARSLSPLRILAFAAALGIAAGMGLAVWRQHQAELELARLASLPDRVDPGLLPAARTEVVSRAGPKLNPRAVEGLPAYPGARAADLLSQPEGKGSELQAAWFATRDEPEAVLRFYEAKLSEMKVPWVAHRYGKNAGYVGYLESDQGRLHLVTVMRQGQRTLVFPSTSYPARLGGPASRSLPDVPVHPNTARSLVFDFDENVLTRSTYVATVPNLSVADAVAWYRRSLAEKGWTVDKAEVLGSGEGAVEASRPTGKARLTVRKDAKDAQGVSVFVALSG